MILFGVPWNRTRLMNKVKEQAGDTVGVPFSFDSFQAGAIGISL